LLKRLGVRPLVNHAYLTVSGGERVVDRAGGLALCRYVHKCLLVGRRPRLKSRWVALCTQHHHYRHLDLLAEPGARPCAHSFQAREVADGYRPVRPTPRQRRTGYRSSAPLPEDVTIHTVRDGDDFLGNEVPPPATADLSNHSRTEEPSTTTVAPRRLTPRIVSARPIVIAGVSKSASTSCGTKLEAAPAEGLTRSTAA